MTSIKDAIRRWEAAHPGASAAEAQVVELYGQCPPVERMDGAALATLKACRRLSLSTNSIDRIAGLQPSASAAGGGAGAAGAPSSASPLPRLEALSLGRNLIKRIEGLEGVAETLRELWLSYNQIEKLTGLERCVNLRVLYLSNNRVKDWAEVDRLAAVPKLADLLLAGNPLLLQPLPGATAAPTPDEYRVEVLRRLPGLAKLDGVPCDADERERAAKAREQAGGGGGEVVAAAAAVAAAAKPAPQAAAATTATATAAPSKPPSRPTTATTAARKPGASPGTPPTGSSRPTTATAAAAASSSSSKPTSAAGRRAASAAGKKA